VEPVIKNLRIAQDYVLMQSVLPRVSGQWAGAPGIWSEVSEYLAPRFPRAYAWVVTSLSPETAESRRKTGRCEANNESETKRENRHGKRSSMRYESR
jgi:hypothetical protein